MVVNSKFPYLGVFKESTQKFILRNIFGGYKNLYHSANAVADNQAHKGNTFEGYKKYYKKYIITNYDYDKYNDEQCLDEILEFAWNAHNHPSGKQYNVILHSSEEYYAVIDFLNKMRSKQQKPIEHSKPKKDFQHFNFNNGIFRNPNSD